MYVVEIIYFIDVADSLFYTFAKVLTLHFIAEFQCLVATGGNSGRDSCTEDPIFSGQIYFYCRIPTGIENLTGVNFLYRVVNFHDAAEGFQ